MRLSQTALQEILLQSSRLFHNYLPNMVAGQSTMGIVFAGKKVDYLSMGTRLAYYVKCTYCYKSFPHRLGWLLGISSFLVSSFMVYESSTLGQIKPFITSSPSTITEPSSPCRYDPQSQTYRECCHVMADGSCAHFGNPCTEASEDDSNCRYDPQSNTYRECFHVMADGSCAHFGTPCQPEGASSGTSAATPCLYDAESQSYRQCFHVMADGSCAHFGTPC